MHETLTQLQPDVQTQATPYSISRLQLSHFRNYSALRLNLDGRPVVLTGANGSGKTNILEALSFLSPGKGLRNVRLDAIDRMDDAHHYSWAISATLEGREGQVQVGTGRDPTNAAGKRIVKIEGEIVRGQAELAHVCSMMWLTPQMDGLFIGPASDRRKFLDRLVYNFDPEHASRVYSYEHTVRERARLLQVRSDPYWLSTLEAKMAERAVSIAAARNEAIEIIAQAIAQAPSAFPKAMIGVAGEVEALLAHYKALEAEEILKEKWHNARSQDAHVGRTSIGVHRSDFIVHHDQKNMPAESCSTGEQKALLLSIILAEARAKAFWRHSVPILLLDEVVAHLDSTRRASLFDEFLAMRAQVWMTGTDTSLFEDLQGKAQFLSVAQGIVS